MWPFLYLQFPFAFQAEIKEILGNGKIALIFLLLSVFNLLTL